MHRLVTVAVAGLAIAGCTSVGQVGMMTPPTADVGAIISEARAFTEIGPVEGEACRYFALGVVPWGNSTSTTAMENALAGTGGDAIINASVETSLYGFIPIYNLFAYTCSTVRGIAIKLDAS